MVGEPICVGKCRANYFSVLLLFGYLLHALPVSAQSFAGSESAERPNIVLILSDDLNTALRCYGDTQVETPNLDHLAERGLRFTNAYCQSPLCNSSRASIFSGLRSDTIGVLDNEAPWPQSLNGLSYMPKYFQQRGYFTATIGKNLDHKRVPDQPFWDLEIREWGKFPDAQQVTEQGWLFPGASGSKYWAKLRGPDDETPDGDVARHAVEVLGEQSRRDQPLFLAVGFRRPHTPFAAPAKYFDLYRAENIKLPEVPADYWSTVPKAAQNGLDFPDGGSSEALAAYYACVSYVDAQVGVLMDALDQLNLWTNTVVVFTSDHGYHTGHQAMWHKGSLFEQTAQVPLIVAVPGGAEGATCRRNVGLVDLYPTLAELSGGTSLPAQLEGTSFVPLLANPERAWDRNVRTSLGRLDDNNRRTFVGHSIRTDRYRYTEWADGTLGVELYDFESDPRGVINVAQDPQYEEALVELRKHLAAR